MVKNLDLTPLEQRILDRSGQPGITRQRRTMSIASGFGFAVLLVAVALVKRSWQFILAIALVYIATTIWERLAYANTVLEYKNLIQKLKKQVETQETEDGRQQ